MFPPAGLIHVDRNGADRFPEFLDRSFQVGGPLPFQLGDHPARDRGPEQSAGQLRDLAFAQAGDAGPKAQDGPPAGAEVAARTSRGRARAGGDPTGGTSQALELGFPNLGLDGRHFRAWMAERLGILALEGLSTAATALGLEGHGLLMLVGGQQGPGVAGVLGLSSPRAPGGGGGWPAFEVGGIRRRRFGGIGRVWVEAVLQRGDLSLEPEEFGPEGVAHGPGFGQRLGAKFSGEVKTQAHHLRILSCLRSPKSGQAGPEISD